MAYTTIDKPSDYFNTKLYTGNGSTQSITGVGFQPDWIFLKPRSQSGEHGLSIDSVRGNTKVVFPNLTNAEQTITNIVTAFGSDGFSLGDNAGANNNTSTYVAWNWKAGTSFTNDASATGIGSIDSSGSVSTDAGFSITSYTGTGSAGTIKHGLSVAPSMVIIKNRDDGQSWRVGVTSIGFDKYLGLNGTGASTSSSGMFNNTAPTTSVFSVGSDGSTNASGEKCIAYCFADVKGYSKVGSYTGNGNADGTFVYTGFKPAFVMIKRSSGTANWTIADTKRSSSNGGNVIDERLFPSTSGAASTGYNNIDILSNGFKTRNGSDDGVDASGSTYIYMCFAENPFTTSTGVPACAR